MKTIKLIISETGRENLKVEPNLFNVIKESCKTKEQLKDYLIERYGKIPPSKKKMYMDIPNKETIVIGFIYSFWNQDISHASKKWFQTDWIEFYEEETEVTYFKL